MYISISMVWDGRLLISKRLCRSHRHKHFTNFSKNSLGVHDVNCTTVFKLVPSSLFSLSSLSDSFLTFPSPLPLPHLISMLFLHVHCFPGEAILPASAQAFAGVYQSKEWRQSGCQAHADLPVATQPSSSFWSVQRWTQVWVRLWATHERVMTVSVIPYSQKCWWSSVWPQTERNSSHPVLVDQWKTFPSMLLLPAWYISP